MVSGVVTIQMSCYATRKVRKLFFNAITAPSAVEVENLRAFGTLAATCRELP